MKRALMFLLTLAFATVMPLVSVSAQPSAPGIDAKLDSARAIRGERLRVSLVTIGPGDIVWDRFGHDALAIRDTVSGSNIAYNWGMFGFSEPLDFVWRFLTGDTRYWTEAVDTEPFVAYYVRQNRSVRVQRLALTPVERAALAEYVEWNTQEANKYYRYDYYQDNCATRVRDALDFLLHGKIKAAINTDTHPRSWRSETERLTATSLPVYAGINIALGKRADAPLTDYQNGFLPERLADALAPLVLRDSTGSRYRLVTSDTMRFIAQRVPMPIDPPQRIPTAALVGLTLAGIIALLTDSRVRALRKLLAVGVATWCLVGGLLGTFLTVLSTVTKHVPYMGHNINLLQLNTLFLVALFTVPVALARGRSTRFARIVSATIAALSLIGLACQLVPSFAQHSGVVLAVTVPVNVMIAIAVFRVTNDRDERQAAAAAALSRAA